MDVQIPADLSELSGAWLPREDSTRKIRFLSRAFASCRPARNCGRDVEAGIAKLDRGEGLDENEVFEELEREIDEIEQLRDE